MVYWIKLQRKFGSNSLFQKSLPPPAWSFCHGSIFRHTVTLTHTVISNHFFFFFLMFLYYKVLPKSQISCPFPLEARQYFRVFSPTVQKDQLRWIGNAKLLAVACLNEFLGPWLLPQKPVSSRSQFCMKCHFTWSHARSWGERYERRYVLTVLRREQVQQVCQNNIVMSCPKCKCANGNGAKVWNDIECQPCDRWVSCPGCLLPFIHCILGQQSHDPGSKKRDVWLDKNNHRHVSFPLSLRSHTKQLLIWMNIIVQHLPHSMELPILLSKIFDCVMHT